MEGDISIVFMNNRYHRTNIRFTVYSHPINCLGEGVDKGVER
ncbi:hypothetical protein O9993_06190 [Vibrio lentus]|nr:hypothetical protein [Vibrio lentus]